MRSRKFQDVLWAVARKAGYSPEEGNFLTNQAIPIGQYIDQYVERFWSSQDFPEWVHVVMATPDANQMVPYDVPMPMPAPQGPLPPTQNPGAAVAPLASIGRVIKVWLVDPNTTNTPIDTKFELRDDGIFCGFEHGGTVWIEYQEPSPRFTAVAWDAVNTYAQGDTTYSPTTGEVYKSLVDYNQGHDPGNTVINPQPNQIPTQDQQFFVPPSLGSVAQNKIITVSIKNMQDGVIAADPPAVGAAFTIPVLSSSGASLATATYTVAGSDTLSNVTTQLTNQLTTGLGAGWTVTPDTSNMKITLSNASDFSLVGSLITNAAPTYQANASDSAHLMQQLQSQPYIPSATSTVVSPQITTVNISGNQIVPGSQYNINFFDGLGVAHEISYQSGFGDSSQDILTGISNAIATAAMSDSFIGAMSVSLNFTSSTFTFSAPAEMGVHATRVRQGSPWWEVVPFPEILFNAVVRGAGAELLAEWGQSDKGQLEEQKIPLSPESATQTNTIIPTITPAFTTQQKPYSRYKY